VRLLRLSPLSLALACALVQAAEPADTWAGCPNPNAVPLFRDDLPAQAAAPGTPIDMTSLSLDTHDQNVTVAEGDVQVFRGDQWLGTDKLTYWHESERYASDGEVRFQDRRLRATAQSMEGNGQTDTVALTGMRYQFNADAGNGVAERAQLQGETSRLEGATYSTCPPDARHWEFSAERIDVDESTGTARARNSVLRVGGVPILWLPYLSFPTSDERRSGWLAPTLGYDDRSGFQFGLPYYFNLAPNYDATLTPQYHARRGLGLEGEFRYLGNASRGRITGRWLPDDDIFGGDRRRVEWQHYSVLGPHWSAQWDLDRVSDRYYFSDFGEGFDSTRIGMTRSSAALAGRGRGWQLELSGEDWQLATPLLPPGSEPFRRLPRLTGAWQPFGSTALTGGLRGEAVRFDHDSLPGGTRWDASPWVGLRLERPAWFLRSDLAWRYTHWNLDAGVLPPWLDRSPSRSLPIFSFDAGWLFERPLHWGGSSLVQTLEPRLHYLRVPYRDQDDLPLFDTESLTFAWPGLFRQNRYTGADRQGDANQLTLALSTRMLDAADGRERLRLSLGRIFHFEDPRVFVPGEPVPDDAGSPWIGEARWAVNDRWDLALAQHWDQDNGTTLSAVQSQWRFGDRGLFNAGYRYRPGLVEQGDLSFALPVGTNWRLLGRWNYSLLDERTQEAMAGLEWRSCCLAWRLVGRRYYRAIDGELNTGVFFELELNGIGSFGRETGSLLDNAILGYSP
jgi:LPS-assembly protein